MIFEATCGLTNTVFVSWINAQEAALYHYYVSSAM